MKGELGINSQHVTYVEAEGDVPWQTVANAIDVVKGVPANVVLTYDYPDGTVAPAYTTSYTGKTFTRERSLAFSHTVVVVVRHIAH